MKNTILLPNKLRKPLHEVTYANLQKERMKRNILRESISVRWSKVHLLPIRMTRQQLEKSISETTRLMKEAAKNLDFLQAAQYRDEIIRLQKELELK